MNVNRLHSGVQAPVQQKGQIRNTVDLTISEQGVATSPGDRAQTDAGQTVKLQITSNQALQNLLSAEETQALMQSFSPSGEVPEATVDRSGMKVYNGRGVQIDVQTARMQGRLVDITG